MNRQASEPFVSLDFETYLTCDGEDPQRLMPLLNGSISVQPEGDYESVKVGTINAHLVLVRRAEEEDADIFEAMDEVSQELSDCAKALFAYDDTFELWTPAVRQFRGLDGFPADVLYITYVELEEAYRGKGIGTKAIRETIATFADRDGLVAVKPFSPQYTGSLSPEHPLRKEPDFEANRVAAFERVARFWIRLGFQQLVDSEFYVFNLG